MYIDSLEAIDNQSDKVKKEAMLDNLDYMLSELIDDPKARDAISSSINSYKSGNPISMIIRTIKNMKFVSDEVEETASIWEQIANHPAWPEYKKNFLSNFFSDI